MAVGEKEEIFWLHTWNILEIGLRELKKLSYLTIYDWVLTLQTYIYAAQNDLF